MITGASSGIGRATALSFARQGARLVLAARRAEVLEEVARQCNALGGEAIAVPTEMADAGAVDRLAAAAVARFGGIDVWVNGAALLAFGRIEETPVAVTERVLAANINGCFWGARAAVTQFRRQRRGTLINIASALGVTAQPYASAYVASKFAIRGLDETLRQELRNEPEIQVCTVLPFAIDTPIYGRAANYLGRGVKPVSLRYGAQTVADCVLGLAHHPRAVAYAGKAGLVAAIGKRIAPKAIVDRVLGDAITAMEITDQHRPPTSGNVLSPVTDGYAVSGGWGNTARPLGVVGLGGMALAAVALGALAYRRHRR